MFSQIPQSVDCYPIYRTYSASQVNSETDKFMQKIDDEIRVKQAYVRAEFLRNTLEKCSNELTKSQKDALTTELQNVQRESAMLIQQLNVKYGVHNG